METWQLVQRALDYIEQHPAERITVQQLAEQAYLSPFYFQRLFKQLVGLSPAAYVTQRKLARALEQLSGTVQPVSAIAASLGFENHETFSRAFKAQFGVSPSEQRKRQYSLPLYVKPNLAAQYEFSCVGAPLAVGGVLFTLHIRDQEYLRHFLPCTPFQPARELQSTAAPPGFCGQTLDIGRYAVCTLAAESPRALRPALQTIKQYLYTVWAKENRVALSYPGLELYQGLLPDGAAYGELWVKLKNWNGAASMENSWINFSQITLEQEIKITGLNLQSSGLPITFESLGKLWDKKDFFTEVLRENIKNTLRPVVEYGVALNLVPDYIVGRQVSAFGNPDKPYFQHTVPAGEYLKAAFHADSFQDMVENRLAKALKAGKSWAKKQHIPLDKSFTLEVYPHETTMTDFPEMYLLFPIQTK